MSIHDKYPQLNHVYGDKIVVPPCLPVFLKHYSRWVIFYKPLDLVKESHEWIRHLIQYLADKQIPEKCTPDQLDSGMKDFAAEWDNAHIQDKDNILEMHADEDYTLHEGVDVPRRLPPDGFEEICTNLSREVIRYSPGVLTKFTELYFKALLQNKMSKFLQRMAEKKAGSLPKRNATPEEHEAAHAFLAGQAGGDIQGMKHEDTVKLINKTLSHASEEQRAALEQRRKEADEKRKKEAAEAAAKQAKLEEELKSRNIDLDATVRNELEQIKKVPTGRAKPIASSDNEEDEDDVFKAMSAPVEQLEMPEALAVAVQSPTNEVQEEQEQEQEQEEQEQEQEIQEQEQDLEQEVSSDPAVEEKSPISQAPEDQPAIAEPDAPQSPTEPEQVAEAEEPVDEEALRREEIARKKAERLAKLRAEQAAREVAE